MSRIYEIYIILTRKKKGYTLIGVSINKLNEKNEE